MFLDSKLVCKEHKQNVINKVSKTIGLLRKLQNILPRPPLRTIYKSFIRYHLDYWDIIYDQAHNISFHQKIESIQHNAALAITGTIRGTSREKLYHELGSESLVSRRWCRKLCCFYKVFRLSHVGIYSTLFLQPKEVILQEMTTSCLISK